LDDDEENDIAQVEGSDDNIDEYDAVDGGADSTEGGQGDQDATAKGIRNVIVKVDSDIVVNTLQDALDDQSEKDAKDESDAGMCRSDTELTRCSCLISGPLVMIARAIGDTASETGNACNVISWGVGNISPQDIVMAKASGGTRYSK
jgi:hypothetical protein